MTNKGSSRSIIIQLHIEQTQTQIERLEQAMEKLEMKPGRKVCEAMRGLVEEAQHSISEQDKGPIMDLVIVAVSKLLNETLKEEKETDVILTKITQSGLMAEAMGGGDQKRGRQAAE